MRKVRKAKGVTLSRQGGSFGGIRNLEPLGQISLELWARALPPIRGRSRLARLSRPWDKLSPLRGMIYLEIHPIVLQVNRLIVYCQSPAQFMSIDMVPLTPCILPSYLVTNSRKGWQVSTNQAWLIQLILSSNSMQHGIKLWILLHGCAASNGFLGKSKQRLLLWHMPTFRLFLCYLSTLGAWACMQW